MSVKAFVVLTLEQAANSNNVLDSPLFSGPNYVPLKESADAALHAAMDKTIVSGTAASKRTVWIQIEISLSDELQLQAFQDRDRCKKKVLCSTPNDQSIAQRVDCVPGQPSA